MDFYGTLFEMIDMRSFSNLWFWIVLGVMWSSTSHYVLGVPWDMATRARRSEAPEQQHEFETLVRIYTARLALITRESGLIIAGGSAFALTVLALLGFVYDNEFSQAVFLLAFPMSINGLLSVQTAHAIIRNDLTGDGLYRKMRSQRVKTQVVGLIAIFVTAMWGMLQNLTGGGPLG